MDERLRFVARLLDGEKMAPLCYLCLRNKPLPMRPVRTKETGAPGRIRTCDPKLRRLPYNHRRLAPALVTATGLSLVVAIVYGAH